MIFYAPDQLAVVGLIMLFDSVVQGAVGFGSGLLGVPLLVLCGFSIPEAATINLVSTSVQNATGAWQLRSHLDPPELILPVAVRFLAIPCGTYLAFLVDQNLDPAQAKQIIGLILLVTIALLWGSRVTPREQLHRNWQILAFSTSGLLMGFATIGGAPMVLYVNALSWTANKSRAFLFFCSAVALPVVAVAFWVEHGKKILPAAFAALLLLPLVLGGLCLGLRLGNRLSKPLFRRLTYLLVLLVALGAIAVPLMGDASP